MKFIRLLPLLLLPGCSHLPQVQPWVSSYERHRLADPIMTFARCPADTAFLQHVRQAREGARGAEGGGGGGCGCN